MSPITHLLASWIVAAKTTTNQGDCRLVTLAGFLPDLDGFGVLMDRAFEAAGHQETLYYETYHHYLLHGAFGGIVFALVMMTFARDRLRAALLSLMVFHLHLLCDFLGSRGPSPTDIWPIFYLGPFTHDPLWQWKGQLELDAWPNRLLALILFVCAIRMAVRRGNSFVGVFNHRLDAVFVGVLRKWFDRGKDKKVLSSKGDTQS